MAHLIVLEQTDCLPRQFNFPVLRFEILRVTQLALDKFAQTSSLSQGQRPRLIIVSVVGNIINGCLRCRPIAHKARRMMLIIGTQFFFARSQIAISRVSWSMNPLADEIDPYGSHSRYNHFNRRWKKIVYSNYPLIICFYKLFHACFFIFFRTVTRALPESISMKL